MSDEKNLKPSHYLQLKGAPNDTSNKSQRITEPKTNKNTLTLTLKKPHKVKKGFANCACEIAFHQLAGT